MQVGGRLQPFDSDRLLLLDGKIHYWWILYAQEKD